MMNGIISAATQFLGFGNNRNYQNNRYTTTELIGSPVPVWVDTTNLWVLYNEIPELRSVINRYSNMVASAHPVIKDADGNVIEEGNHWIFDLINRPNALQSWNAMVLMTSINKAVTGNALIYAPKGSLGDTQNLTPLAFNNVQIVPTGVSLRQTSIDGFIKEFKIPQSYTGDFDIFKPSEVVYFSDTDGVNLFDAKSKLEALKYPLSNIVAGYKKRNVLLTNLFSLGVLTGRANNDGISAIPLDADDAKEMRDDLKNRHMDEVMVTDKDFKFEAMSFPVKDLMLFEEMTADKLEIIDAFGLNQHMFGQGSESKGSTFSNVEMGERQAYNSTVIPDTEALYDEMGKQLKLEDEGLYLCPSFEHISVLKADATKEAESLLKRAQALEKIGEQITLGEDEKRALLGL